jgi:hypothetical protein
MLTYGPREVSWTEMERSVNHLGEVFQRLDGAKACFIHGMGGLPKRDYISLEGRKGTLVKCYHSVLPKLIAPLIGFIPSYAGLVEILDPRQLMPVFEVLAQNTMVAVYIIGRSFAEGLVEVIREKASSHKINDYLRSDDHVIAYRLDTSNPSSKTDMYAWLLVGEALREEIPGLLGFDHYE